MSLSSSAPAEAAAPSATRPDRLTLIVYFCALIAMFLATMDMQIVVTALPTIASELGNLHLFGWVGSSYLLTTAAVSPFYGKLGDMFGRKRVVTIAIVLFLVGSAICGLATSMESLIAARVLQGIGGGGLMVSAFAMIGELFSPRDRARYQGYSSAVFALSSILGPVAGGYITSWFGWRWIFLVNLPVGLVVLALIALFMRRTSSGRTHKVDYIGGLLLAVSTTSIVYWGDHLLEPGGPDLLTFLLPVIGVGTLLAFIRVEAKAEEPIVPLRLFKIRTVSIITGVSVLAGMVTLGMFFYFALFTQVVTGLDPAEVGFVFLPASITSMIVSVLAGRIIAKTGRYRWMPITAMAIGALLMFGYALVDAQTPLWVLILMMATFGLSMGLQFQVLMVAMQAAAPLTDIGAATGLITQGRTIGASLGLAVNGAVMGLALAGQSKALPADVAALLPGGLGDVSPHLITTLPEAARPLVLSEYAAGVHVMFVWVAILYLVAMGLTALLRNDEIPRRG